MTTTESSRATRAGAWRLNVLGPVELCYEGRPVEVAGVTRTLLALLARAPGEEIDTATLVAGIWGSAAPEDSEKEVASHVSRLRKALTVVAPDVDPTSVVVTMPAGYILAVEPSNADILAFERLAADGKRALDVGQPALALARLDAALALWRGPAFADEQTVEGPIAERRNPAVAAEAARLEDLRLAAIESTMDARLALSAPSAPAELLTELPELLESHWHRERLWTQWMTALFRLGRRTDALAAYRQAQELLAQRLGAAPGPEMRATEQALLAADPALHGRLVSATVLPAELVVTVPACVGRDEELAWLTGALDLAATRRAQARLVVGAPGSGKSRVIAEVAARAAGRGIAVHYWRADTSGLDAFTPTAGRLTLVVVEDLDQASPEDVARVTGFVAAVAAAPVVTLVTCRDPVRVGDLSGLPKLVLAALDDHAIAEIVRVYAPGASEAMAVAAMASTGGLPARVHRTASEWAFARAGRRIDRAVADASEPTRRLAAVSEEVVAGVLELAHVRARARALRPVVRDIVARPYKGLSTFDPGDSEIFHGREHLVAEVVARLVERRLLAVVGAAGTGKSSLVRAGLLPALAAGVLPGSARWRPVVVRPGQAASLAEQVAPHLDDLRRVEPADEEPPPTAGLPHVPAQRSPEAEDAPVPGEVPDDPSPVDAPRADVPEDSMLLVVDQFEEVFTVLDRPARDAYVATLVQLAAEHRVVLSVRSDFYGQCGEYVELAAALTANTVLMRPMTADEVCRAIELPAAAAGLAVEDGLARHIADHARQLSDLTGLSTALHATWANRIGATLTLDAYHAGGGVAGAVPNLTELAYESLSTPEERDAARRIMLCLTVVTDTDTLVRRRAGLAEVIASAGPAAPGALEKLVAGGVVVVSDGAVDVAHEALLERWPRVRGWIGELRAERGQRRHLTESAEAWAASGGPDALYRGARLAAAMDLAAARPEQLNPTEHDFLDASQQLVLAADIRRRQRTAQLWRYLAAAIAIAVLAIVVAAVAVTLQLRSSAAGEKADGQRLASLAVAEPDLRKALLLAVAAAQLDDGTSATIKTVLLGSPDLVAAAGRDISTIALSPDGRTVAAATAAGNIWLYAADSLAPTGRLQLAGHTPVNGLAFTRDGRQLVSWGGPRTAGTGQATASIVVWDLASKRPTGPAFGQAWPDSGGGLLADGTTLLVAQHGGDPDKPPTAVAWSLDARTPSTAYEMPTAGIDALRLSADGRFVVLGTPAGTTVVDVAAGATRLIAGAVRPLALSPDGRTLLTADGTRLGIWDMVSGQASGQAVRHSGDVLGAAWSPDARTFASVGADGLVIVWDAGTRQPVKALAGHGGPARVVRFGADGSMLYTVGADGSLFAWDLTGSRGVAAMSGTDTAAAIGLACALAGRDLTPEEWQSYLPARSYRHVCPGGNAT